VTPFVTLYFYTILDSLVKFRDDRFILSVVQKYVKTLYIGLR